MSGLLLQLMQATPGPDNPPDWCFKSDAYGDLPTCTYSDGHWSRSFDTVDTIGSGGSGGSGGAGIAFAFVLILLVGIAITIWRVSTVRRLAREAGLSERDATAMALISDDGFGGAYLASTLGHRASPAPTPTRTPPIAERLRELKLLAQQELITQDEYETRRRAIIDET